MIWISNCLNIGWLKWFCLTKYFEVIKTSYHYYFDRFDYLFNHLKTIIHIASMFQLFIFFTILLLKVETLRTEILWLKPKKKSSEYLFNTLTYIKLLWSKTYISMRCTVSSICLSDLRMILYILCHEWISLFSYFN